MFSYAGLRRVTVLELNKVCKQQQPYQTVHQIYYCIKVINGCCWVACCAHP